MVKSKEISTKLTKKRLIWLYKDLARRLGVQPTRKQWIEDAKTPSDMPVRNRFRTWNNFVKEAGFEPYKPYLSEIARRNSKLAHKGKRSFNWRGGRIKDRFGYIQIWRPDHPNAKMGGYVHEHRLVMSEHLDRSLTSKEFVHHKNGIKDDNRLENLEILTHKVHRGKVKCPYCMKEFTIR